MMISGSFPATVPDRFLHNAHQAKTGIQPYLLYDAGPHTYPVWLTLEPFVKNLNEVNEICISMGIIKEKLDKNIKEKF